MDKQGSVCDMRGFLSFLVLWMLSKKPMSGVEIVNELEKRKGCKPNPGTIYPALKQLVEKKAIKITTNKAGEKKYSLTPAGKSELETATNTFKKTFYDFL
ncbi:MAG: PadR family transcriptional regulator [Candidatus Micrarchaeota archaeon]|nr:PadR family transcriptional regulator [Candidatus Micrarchaeota archaeon]